MSKKFQLFVEYEKAQAYDKQYDLLARDHLATLLHMNVERESYVKFKRDTQRTEGRLLELTVKRIKKNPGYPENFVLSVIAKMQKGEREYSDRPICVAYLVNGDWRFALLHVEY